MKKSYGFRSARAAALILSAGFCASILSPYAPLRAADEETAFPGYTFTGREISLADKTSSEKPADSAKNEKPDATEGEKANVPATKEGDLPDPTEKTKAAAADPASAAPIQPFKMPDPDVLAYQGKIDMVIAKLLATNHYIQKPFNGEMSQKVLKQYVDLLDYNHLIFLQSDIDEFNNKYGQELQNYAARGDASPAYLIYERFLKRLDERKKLVDKVLKENKFDFTKDETMVLGREKGPFPKDDAEASDLWRQRIKSDLLQGRLEKQKPEDTLKRIGRRYTNIVRDAHENEDAEINGIYLNAVMRAYDPHSDYFTADEAKNFEMQAITLKLDGIGAELRYDDGFSKVQRLVPGGPADLNKKLKPGDRIVAVAQGAAAPVDVVGMKLKKVVDLIRGKRGTIVRLLVIPAGQPDGAPRTEISIKRDEVKLVDQRAKAKIFEHVSPDGSVQRIGVINLPQFARNTAEDVEKLVQRLEKEKVAGIVLDLRRNGGGLLDEAIELTGLFIKRGPVVQVKNNVGQIQVLPDNDPKVLFDGPMICLVGRLSASASEIVAAALQDYQRAIIVGDQSTHGKGTVQNLVPLETIPMLRGGDPGEAKITVQKFYRIAGGSTQNKGVIPDITLPSLLDYAEIGETTLPNSLEWDEIKEAPYQKVGETVQFVPALQTASVARIAKSKDFSYINEDISIVKKKLAEKSVSLNEVKRQTEEKDRLAHVDARKKERAARPADKDKIYEFTLDEADSDKPLAEAKVVKPAADTNSGADRDPDADTETESPIDPQLDETVNILGDYIDLLKKNKTMTTSVP